LSFGRGRFIEWKTEIDDEKKRQGRKGEEKRVGWWAGSL